MKSGMHMKGADKLKALQRAVKTLPGKKVYVGIPAEKAERDGDLTNAQLGYVNEFGSPEANVPERPFLIPGIKDVQPKVGAHLMAAGKAQLQGRAGATASERHLMAAGQVAINGVRARITRGIPPPLADSTLAKRASRKKGSGHRINKGAAAELAARAKGAEPSIGLTKPLIDSGQLLRSLTYVVRK